MQEILDDLSNRTGRSLAVDDPDYRILFASAQREPVDEARTTAILDRELPEGLVAWLRSLGFDRAEGPRRVPGNPAYHSLPRVCFPLRLGGRPAGYLWAFDEPPLTDAEWTTIAESVDAITAQLEWEGRPVSHSIAEASRLATEYLVENRRTALDEAAARQLLPRTGPIDVWCAVFRESSGDRASRVRLQALLVDILKGEHAAHAIGTVIDDSVTLITRHGAAEAPLLTERLSTGAKRHHLVLDAIGHTETDATAEGAVLFKQGRFAARTLFRTDPASVRSWNELGAWTLLGLHEWNFETVKSLSPAVAELIGHDRLLAATWLTYLDEDRDARRTCARLHIHRTTLYHRLGRVRERVGTHIFEDGWSTTSAHVALRLWTVLSSDAEG
ncbi:helix-turn-helix domain-containing protein [Agromyces sp. NPDC056379]|uniref:helix-turn-helix domain-containing protein n=1 Tax=unclassified Agromyces TaxID=2639701 RepID=UPI0035D94535